MENAGSTDEGNDVARAFTAFPPTPPPSASCSTPNPCSNPTRAIDRPPITLIVHGRNRPGTLGRLFHHVGPSVSRQPASAAGSRHHIRARSVPQLQARPASPTRHAYRSLYCDNHRLNAGQHRERREEMVDTNRACHRESPVSFADACMISGHISTTSERTPARSATQMSPEHRRPSSSLTR